MRTRIADYHIVRPLEDERSDGLPSGPTESSANGASAPATYLAQPPARLGTDHDPVVLHLNSPSSPSPLDWVKHLAAARSPHLPALIELGGDPEGKPGSLYWVHT